MEGNHGRQYVLLPTYDAEIKETNPGSFVKINYDNPPKPILEDQSIPDEESTINSNPVFKRIFISFEVMKTGFVNRCRPFIGVDGCHLKGPYGGVLILAVALNGNNGLFLLATGVVECECKQSCTFFLEHLRTILSDALPTRPWTIMSDGQNGLDKIMSEVLSEVSYRRCCMHLFNNFRANFHGVILRKNFWKAARAWNQRAYDEAMHAFDGKIRNDHITNNMIESFNNWLGISRSKPILTMLETIRCKLIGKFQMRYQKALQWQSSVTLNIHKKLDKALYESRKCKVEYAREQEYDIRNNEGVRHIVHLCRMSCYCKEWEISGIPCTHAMVVISHSRMNVEHFINPYYSKQKYFMANDGIIHPISDHTLWTLIDEVPLYPPHLKRLVGRPKNSRKRATHEPSVGTSQAKSARNLGTIRERVIEVQSRVADEAALHLAEAWVLHLTEETKAEAEAEAEAWVLHLTEEAEAKAKAWVLHLAKEAKKATLHLAEEALHLEEVEAELHLEEVFQLRIHIYSKSEPFNVYSVCDTSHKNIR
ncbi:hypothetical protein ACSBR2_012558 [Camellia fascicularis]